jgi:hypothetical protein
MATLDHEFERSVVSVIVDDVVSGTGVVIARGKVLTCVHVLGEGDLTQKTFKIAFYALRYEAESQGLMLGGSSADALRDEQEVTLDSTRLEKGNNWDLAVLEWDGDLPDGVKIAKFSLRENLAGTRVFSRGYPNLRDFKSQPANGLIVGRTSHTKTNNDHWTLESAQITSGFSGGAIFDLAGRTVVGLARSVVEPDGEWRNSTTAIAIAVPTIAKFCGDLIPELRQDVDQRHSSAIEKLREQLSTLLRGHGAACEQLGVRFQVPRHENESKPYADLVVASLLSQERSITELALILAECQKACSASGNSQAAAAISNLYVLFLSATLAPDTVRDLLAHVPAGQRFFVLPCSHRSIVEIVMAGMEGRIARFKKLEEEPLPIGNAAVVARPAETGIARANTWADQLATVLSDHFTIPKKGWVNPIPQINALLRRAVAKGTRIYLMSDDEYTQFSPEYADELRKHYPELLVVSMGTPPDADRDRQSDALAPWIENELLPPEVTKP